MQDDKKSELLATKDTYNGDRHWYSIGRHDNDDKDLLKNLMVEGIVYIVNLYIAPGLFVILAIFR